MRRVFPLMILLGLFLELAVMILVGQRIGVLATLLWVVGGGILGGIVIRSAGLGLVEALRGSSRDLRFTTEAAAAGFLYMLAGLLLIVPGFVSDLLGLVLLPLSVRQWLIAKLMNKIPLGSRRDSYSPGKVIEGEAIEIEGEIVKRPDAGRSG